MLLGRGGGGSYQSSAGIGSRLDRSVQGGLPGARSQRVDQSASQDAGSWSPAMNGSAEYTRSAWDLGLSYAGDGWRVYGKGGTTWRFTRPPMPTRLTLVNGVPTFENGAYTGAKPGQFLSPANDIVPAMEAAE